MYHPKDIGLNINNNDPNNDMYPLSLIVRELIVNISKDKILAIPPMSSIGTFCLIAQDKNGLR